mgnify:CR=1 FL=1
MPSANVLDKEDQGQAVRGVMMNVQRPDAITDLKRTETALISSDNLAEVLEEVKRLDGIKKSDVPSEMEVANGSTPKDYTDSIVMETLAPELNDKPDMGAADVVISNMKSFWEKLWDLE